MLSGENTFARDEQLLDSAREEAARHAKGL
jgi:hypothetical protein